MYIDQFDNNNIYIVFPFTLSFTCLLKFFYTSDAKVLKMTCKMYNKENLIIEKINLHFSLLLKYIMQSNKFIET